MCNTVASPIVLRRGRIQFVLTSSIYIKMYACLTLTNTPACLNIFTPIQEDQHPHPLTFCAPPGISN